jgi:hypothetical protein
MSLFGYWLLAAGFWKTVDPETGIEQQEAS